MIQVDGIFVQQGGGGPALVKGTLIGSRLSAWITYSDGNNLYEDINYPDNGETAEIQVLKNSLVYTTGDTTPTVSGNATTIGYNLYYISGDFTASSA